MTHDKCSLQDIRLEKLTVGTTATYSAIYDISGFEAVTFALKATVLAGSSPNQWATLVQAETSSSSSFASDILQWSTATDYIKSDSSSATDALTQMKVTAINVNKKIGLTEKITLSRTYVRFKVQAGTDASEIIISILSARPKKAPINQ